jgi:hypothetical protein
MIIWQKWNDPFGGNEDDTESLDSASNDEPSFANDDEEEINNDHELMNNFIKNPMAIKAIATPMGIIPITENTASGKIFNFWVGHTNFDITKKIADMIEITDGVETLDIFTRYRFRIAIGKAFNDSKVMRDINQKIYTEG